MCACVSVFNVRICVCLGFLIEILNICVFCNV